MEKFFSQKNFAHSLAIPFFFWRSASGKKGALERTAETFASGKNCCFVVEHVTSNEATFFGKKDKK